MMLRVFLKSTFLFLILSITTTNGQVIASLGDNDYTHEQTSQYVAFNTFETNWIEDENIKIHTNPESVRFESRLLRKEVENEPAVDYLIYALHRMERTMGFDPKSIGSIAAGHRAVEQKMQSQDNPTGTVELEMVMLEDIKYELELVDMLGETIMERRYASERNEFRTLRFDFSDLREGWYFLRIHNEEGDFRSYPFHKE